MFRDTAAPTRANIRKRLLAADEALSSALALLRKRHHNSAAYGPVVTAAMATSTAMEALAAEKGQGR